MSEEIVEKVFPIKLVHENGGSLIARDETQLSAFEKFGFVVTEEDEKPKKKEK